MQKKTEGHWLAEVVGGKGLSEQRSASFQEDHELHFPWGKWHQRSGCMSHPTLPSSQPRKHISHQMKGTQCRASITTLCPTSNTHPPRLEQLYRPCLPQHQWDKAPVQEGRYSLDTGKQVERLGQRHSQLRPLGFQILPPRKLKFLSQY